MKTLHSIALTLAVALMTIGTGYADTDKKVALITGTASGFGKAVAERLLKFARVRSIPTST